MHSSKLGHPSLAALKRVEKDPARLLASLHGSLESKNPETLKLIVQITDERLKTAKSELVCRAFEQVFTDAKRMIDDLAKSKK